MRMVGATGAIRMDRLTITPHVHNAPMTQLLVLGAKLSVTLKNVKGLIARIATRMCPKIVLFVHHVGMHGKPIFVAHRIDVTAMGSGIGANLCVLWTRNTQGVCYV